MIEEISLSDIAPRQEKVKEIKTTVASLRLDAIVSSGFGISRTKAADAIKGERVQVNWQPAKGPSQEVRQGDVISLRGKGRMELAGNYRNVAKRSNRRAVKALYVVPFVRRRYHHAYTYGYS